MIGEVVEVVVVDTRTDVVTMAVVLAAVAIEIVAATTMAAADV